ncbi:hypothetical protein SSYIS1_10680 [Serratia symbiotica]|uniref:Uncharacterized protein n=1 Tax=Serratia symbiotica TaxID=138074 RepID=A0A455VF25_9GAMM|nr:hypothetical protein SSYIS1_10680 [Serratia symbiotica]
MHFIGEFYVAANEESIYTVKICCKSVIHLLLSNLSKACSRTCAIKPKGNPLANPIEPAPDCSGMQPASGYLIDFYCHQFSTPAGTLLTKVTR